MNSALITYGVYTIDRKGRSSAEVKGFETYRDALDWATANPELTAGSWYVDSDTPVSDHG